MDNVYKIKKKLILPMTLATIISIPVFADVIMQGYKTSILVMAVFLMILFYLLTINNLLRKVRITDTELSIRGITGLKRLPFEDVSFIDGITMGTRQFVSVSSKKRNYLIPNSFDNFSDIVSDLEQAAKEGTLGEGIKPMKENIVIRKSDVTGAWITVILLLIIILVRFFPL